MAIKTKAVGVRFPLELIERIERYQNERGVNFTEALVKLVEIGLRGDEDETVELLDDKLDERITASVKQLLDIEFDERITNLVNDKLDVMLDERMTASVKQPLDAELDKPAGENTPSDDSSNSEQVVNHVQIISSDEIEQVGGENPQSYSYSEFHKWVGIPTSTPNKANGDIAITIAKDKGLGDWVMNSKSRKFTKSIDE